MKVKKYIEISPKEKSWIVKYMKTSSPSLCRALNFTDNSPKAIQLRCVAMEHGGVIMEVRPAKNQTLKSNS